MDKQTYIGRDMTVGFRQIDSSLYRQTVLQIDSSIDRYSSIDKFSSTDRQTDKQLDRWTNSSIDSQTVRQLDVQTKRMKDKDLVLTYWH